MKLPIPVNEHDHAIGPTDASIIVVNYGDYECPDCHRRHRAVQRVIDELLSSVRFVYRHFPLVKTHPNALRAAEAAEAAAAQNKFWEMHRLLYDRPDKLSLHDLRKYAHKIGLDIDRFDREMDSGTYRDQILKDFYNSLNYGISGTPTTFINGELYAMSGVELLDVVKATLQAQR
ncbi:MAG TPA: thioredoxin domain-containing protein, partial [Anaerolineales bacterium]|nr:thioredoxin domain-containing protein [Anaerolineales bacterium]